MPFCLLYLSNKTFAYSKKHTYICPEKEDRLNFSVHTIFLRVYYSILLGCDNGHIFCFRTSTRGGIGRHATLRG